MLITRIDRDFSYGDFTIKYTDYCDNTRGLWINGYEGNVENYSYLGVASSNGTLAENHTALPDYTQLSEILAIAKDMIASVCKSHNQEVPSADGVVNERITYNIVSDNQNSYEITATPIDKLSYVLKISPEHEEMVNLAYDDYDALEDLVKSFVSGVAA